MKIIFLFIFLVLSGSVFGLTEKGEVVKKKTVETYAATKAYTIEQKDEFLRELKSELKELDQDIAAMKTLTAKKTDAAKKELDSGIASLEVKRAELNKKIDQLGTASKSAWSELRSGAQSAFREMKTSFNKAAEKFNK